MSFNDVLDELPSLTLEQRQAVMRRAMELDDLPLSKEEEFVLEERLAAYHKNPKSAVSLAEMEKRLKARFGA